MEALARFSYRWAEGRIFLPLVSFSLHLLLEKLEVCGYYCIFDLVFCISLDLDKFLTLKNANIFVFSSLNRNFAQSLHAK